MQHVVNFILKIKISLILIFFISIGLKADDFHERLKFVKIDKKIAILNMKYVEKKENYEKFLSPKIVNLAYSCKIKNENYLKKAEKFFKVDKDVITAILTVESLCGNYKEKYNVVSVFKTLIFLKKNLKFRKRIFYEMKKRYNDYTYSYFLKRISKKSNWAKRELNALKIIYETYKIDVFNLKGSWAGAFGLAQFLPSTFLNYAIDGNNDGKINLENFPDAILSIANYLKKNGWKNNLSMKEKIKVILNYNYSKLYAETILKLASKLKK